MGLLVSIYKPPGGGSGNGGISTRFDRVCVVNVEGPFSPSENEPAVALVEGNVTGQVIAIPVRPVRDGERPASRYTVKEAGGWTLYTLERSERAAGPMSGGCYVGTSDSRLGQAVAQMAHGGLRYCEGIVALHDRFESAGLAAAMD